MACIAGGATRRGPVSWTAWGSIVTRGSAGFAAQADGASDHLMTVTSTAQAECRPRCIRQAEAVKRTTSSPAGEGAGAWSKSLPRSVF